MCRCVWGKALGGGGVRGRVQVVCPSTTVARGSVPIRLGGEVRGRRVVECTATGGVRAGVMPQLQAAQRRRPVRPVLGNQRPGSCCLGSTSPRQKVCCRCGSVRCGAGVCVAPAGAGGARQAVWWEMHGNAYAAGSNEANAVLSQVAARNDRLYAEGSAGAPQVYVSKRRNSAGMVNVNAASRGGEP